MNIRPINLVGGVFVALLAAFAVWFGVRSTTTDPAAPANTQQPTTAVSGATGSSIPVAPAGVDPTVASANSILQIKQQAAKIVLTYYHVDVTDTTESRRIAVTKLVPIEHIDDPSFGVGHTSCWDQARLNNQLKERASVSIDAITIEQVETDRTILHMQVPGTVQQYYDNGQPFKGTKCSPGGFAFVATFDWELGESGWILDNFGNPGDTS